MNFKNVLLPTINAVQRNIHGSGKLHVYWEFRLLIIVVRLSSSLNTDEECSYYFTCTRTRVVCILVVVHRTNLAVKITCINQAKFVWMMLDAVGLQVLEYSCRVC